MFHDARDLTNLDVSGWNTGKVTDMGYMFCGTNSLISLAVSNWDTRNVTSIFGMFNNANNLNLIVNNNKFANYLVKNNFAYSSIDRSIKSVTTDNAKLLQMLTNDGQHDTAARTITFIFPANYTPSVDDIVKYHLTKVGNNYQIQQSAGYDKPYTQGTVLINATDDITQHHIDTTKPYQVSKTWQLDGSKLVLAHKNANGTADFDEIALPQIPGYKANITYPDKANPASILVSFMALPMPLAPKVDSQKDISKPAKAKAPNGDPKVGNSKQAKPNADSATTDPNKSETQINHPVNHQIDRPDAPVVIPEQPAVPKDNDRLSQIADQRLKQVTNQDQHLSQVNNQIAKNNINADQANTNVAQTNIKRSDTKTNTPYLEHLRFLLNSDHSDLQTANSVNRQTTNKKQAALADAKSANSNSLMHPSKNIAVQASVLPNSNSNKGGDNQNLPKTNNDEQSSAALMALGAAISTIGLAGANLKKRKH